MAKGYVIITEDIKDPAGMAEYGKLASQTMGGATVLAFGPAAETLEGEWHGTQTVLLEFESVEAARSGTTPTSTRRPRSCGRPLPTATGSSSPASERVAYLHRGIAFRAVIERKSQPGMLFRGSQWGDSGAMGVVVVACRSSSASSRGRDRNGECDVSIVNCSTPSRRVTVSASHCGIDRSCRQRMKLRGRSASQKDGTDTGVTVVSPNRSGPRRSNAQRAVASSQSW